jgi:hypothetical protein
MEWSRQNANPHGHYKNLTDPKNKHKDHNRSGIPCNNARRLLYRVHTEIYRMLIVK